LQKSNIAIPDISLTGGNIEVRVSDLSLDGETEDYTEGRAYDVEAAIFARTGDIEIVGIADISHNKEESLAEELYLTLAHRDYELCGGDILLDLTEFTVSATEIRGLSLEKIGDKKLGISLFFGRSKEKIEWVKEYVGGMVARVYPEEKAEIGVSYIRFEDDEGSVEPDTLPISSQISSIFGHFPLANLLFEYEYGVARYRPDKRVEEEKKDTAGRLSITKSYEETEAKLFYDWVGADFETAGNPDLIAHSTGYGAELEKALRIGLLSVDYRRGEEAGLSLEEREFSFEPAISDMEIEFSYSFKEKKRESKKREILLNLEKEVRGVTVGIGYEWVRFDDEEGEADYRTDTFLLNAGGSIGPKLAISSNIVYTFSKTDSKERMSYIAVLASYSPIDRVTIEPEYSLSLWKKEGRKITEKRMFSVEARYSITSQYQMILEIERVRNREYEAPSKDYEIERQGFGFSILF
jgi:hypothetical protein